MGRAAKVIDAIGKILTNIDLAIGVGDLVNNLRRVYLKGQMLGKKKIGTAKNPADRFYPISQLVWVGGEIKTKNATRR